MIRTVRYNILIFRIPFILKYYLSILEIMWKCTVSWKFYIIWRIRQKVDIILSLMIFLNCDFKKELCNDDCFNCWWCLARCLSDHSIWKYCNSVSLTIFTWYRRSFEMCFPKINIAWNYNNVQCSISRYLCIIYNITTNNIKLYNIFQKRWGIKDMLPPPPSVKTWGSTYPHHPMNYATDRSI